VEVIDAELWAIGLTLDETIKKRETLQRHGTNTVVVFSDSQATIRRMAHLEPGPGQQVARRMNRRAQAHLAHGIGTEIHWVLGHSGIPGNEEADCQANQRCQPSRPTAGDGGPSQFLPGRMGRRQNRPSRPSMSMTARRPGTCRGQHKPRPRQSSTVPGRHRAVRVYTWIKPNEALIACGKIYKYRDAL